MPRRVATEETCLADFLRFPLIFDELADLSPCSQTRGMAVSALSCATSTATASSAPRPRGFCLFITRGARAVGSQRLSAPSCGNFHPGSIPWHCSYSGIRECGNKAAVHGSASSSGVTSIQGKSQEINQTSLLCLQRPGPCFCASIRK